MALADRASNRWFHSLRLRLLHSRKRGTTATQNPRTFGKHLHQWHCVVCGIENEVVRPSREAMNCRACRSTWRARAMALSVLEALGYMDLSLNQVSSDFSICGLGVSDDPIIAKHLYNKFRYVNTFLHQVPSLDLCNVTDEYRGVAQFVICSDVLEHVPPPVEKAISGLRSLVASGGVAVISVPHVEEGKTEEYYPGLVEYEVREGRVYWQDANGRKHCDEMPEFHGGSGLTLAFRLWSLADLRTSLLQAGFTSVSDMTYNASLGVPEIGPQHTVLIARA